MELQMNLTDDQLKQRDAVSDTPRTDDTFDAYTRGIAGSAYIRASMQKLERELAAVTAERDAYRRAQEQDKRLLTEAVGFLTAVTYERDKWKASHDNQVNLRRTLMDRPDLKDRAKRMTELLSYLSASQQEVARLRVALEKCIACLDWFAANKPDDMGADDEEAMKLAAAALASTPALVHSDTERLDYALEHSKWLSETFFMSTWPFEETKTRMREKIDAELAKEGK